MKRRNFSINLTGLAVASIASPSIFAVTNPAVSGDNPLVGLSLPMTGPQVEVANDLFEGYSVALKPEGIGIVMLDDEFKPDKTAANIRTLAANQDIVLISGVVGTPNAAAAIPIVRELGIPLVGLRSGAVSLRDGKDGVFHLRSSFDDELQKIVQYTKNSGSRTVVVLHTDDSFGNGIRESMARIMTAVGMETPKSFAVDRELKNIKDVCEQINAYMQSPAGNGCAVACLMIAKPMTEVVKTLRTTHKLFAPVFVMSFVGTRAISEVPDVALIGLGVVSAFPLPRDGSSVLARAFKKEVEAQKKPQLLNSMTAFEGWFYGAVARSVIKKGLTRQTLNVGLARGALSVAGYDIVFDQNKVGYRHMQLLHKRKDGRLSA